MLTDEWLSKYARRINELVMRVEFSGGDSAPVLGTVIAMAMDDTDYEQIADPATPETTCALIFNRMEERLNRAGIV